MSDNYFKINRDIWEFFKSFRKVEDTDAYTYWNELLSNADAICRKYEETSECEYCRALLLATVDELHRLSSLQKAGN